VLTYLPINQPFLQHYPLFQKSINYSTNLAEQKLKTKIILVYYYISQKSIHNLYFFWLSFCSFIVYKKDAKNENDLKKNNTTINPYL